MVIDKAELEKRLCEELRRVSGCEDIYEVTVKTHPLKNGRNWEWSGSGYSPHSVRNCNCRKALVEIAARLQQEYPIIRDEPNPARAG